jgi:lauroyl/myristoyl acyltransferase/lipopolysaccharide biosynthesis glycosyltransferase
MRDIAFSCDDNGAKFLCVTVWSLLHNYAGEEPLRVNVFEGFGGHSAASKAKLQSVVDSFNEKCAAPKFSLRYHDVEPFVAPYRELLVDRAGSRWNIFTWTPIFAPQILSDATGNVVHLDIDMLVNADVSPLFELDWTVGASAERPNLIACVAEYGKGDAVITDAVWGKCILPPSVERYFNTGTIVFNAAACRAERTWEKILAWYRDNYAIADRIEQDAWNALYHDRTRLLPLKWNFHDRLVKSYPKRDVRAALWQGNHPAECLEAALEPAILHFWGPKKPWKTCHRPYRGLYHEAMRAVGQTPPQEPLLAAYYDWKSRRALAKIRAMHQMMIGKAAPQSLGKSLKRALMWPFEWLGIGLGALLFANLPHRALLALCDVASSVMYLFDRHGRRLALENLRVVRGRRPWSWPPPPRFDPDRAPFDPTPAEAKILRRSYRNMARTVGHVFWTLRDARRRVAEVGEMDERCRVLLAAHKPVVTVSAHLGCWEILSQLALLQGHDMLSVAKRIGTPTMTRLLMKARQSIGQEIVPADGAFRPLLKGIRAGKSLGLLVDQTVSPRDGGIWVWFCGRPLCVSAAPAFFAAKANAPIAVAWSRPLKDGRYRCEYVDAIGASEARDVAATTQRCATAIERVIRRHPSCWVMNYDFFKYMPNRADMDKLRATS